MLMGLLQRIFSNLGPDQAKEFFIFVQIAFTLGVLGVVYLVTQKRAESNFKLREADRKKAPGTKGNDQLAHAKMKRHEPLRLEGIRIDGEPHEVLGIKRSASTDEI